MSKPVEIIHADNMQVLPQLEAETYDLIYIDPPFNTGRTQSRKRTRSTQTEEGSRIGFGGKRYATKVLGESSYADKFGSDFLEFITLRLEQAHRLLKPNGSFFLHIDYREAHYCKVVLDCIFGRESFINEIIWAYDYGGRSRKRWSSKHDTIFWYAKDPKNYTYNFDAIDRIPYMAPNLVGPEKAARGKTPTDVWWNTIVSPQGKEKNGYPTQKPLAILERLVRVHSNPEDQLLDFFAGSGSFGEAALKLNRPCLLIDENPEAIQVMQKRFGEKATLRTIPR